MVDLQRALTSPGPLLLFQRRGKLREVKQISSSSTARQQQDQVSWRVWKPGRLPDHPWAGLHA